MAKLTEIHLQQWLRPCIVCHQQAWNFGSDGVDTVFGKNRSKGTRSSRWKSSTIGRLKKKWWSTEPANGQKGSNHVYQWAGVSNRSADGQPWNRPIERKKAVIKEIRQRQGMAEAGQSTIGNWSESVLGEFWLLHESFSIFSSVHFSLDASKQCRNRLEIWLSSGHI
jgi:hypothetical protein